MVNASLSDPFPSDNVAGTGSIPIPASATDTTGPIDTREALFNDGAVGPIQRIQVSTERIVALRGILFDIDPDLLHQGAFVRGHFRCCGTDKKKAATVYRRCPIVHFLFRPSGGSDCKTSSSYTHREVQGRDHAWLSHWHTAVAVCRWQPYPECP